MSTKKTSKVQVQNVMVSKTPVGSIRASMGVPGYGGNVVERSYVRRSYAGGAPTLKTGVAGQVTKEGVNNVMQTRDKEKGEIINLNTRLAKYIEQNQFMEGTCKALTAEIERLKKTKNYDQARVADLYKEELEELRNVQTQLEQKLAPLDSKIIAKEDEIETCQEKIKELEDEISRLNEKLRQLGDENGDLEGECKKLKNEVDHAMGRVKYLEDQLNMANADNKRLRNDLEEAIAGQISANERAKDAEEELEFEGQALREEIDGLREIIKNFKQNPIDIQGMWKKNFSTAVENLQDHYRDELARVCDENKRQYEERIRTMQMGLNKDNTDSAIAKSEVKTVKSQLQENKNRLRDLEAENQALMDKLRNKELELNECQEECEKEKEGLRCSIDDLNEDIREMIERIESLKDKKCSLEMEIATYRKLLEGEEQRSLSRTIQDQYNMQSQGGADLSKIIMGGGGGGSSMQSTMSESTGRINVKKTSKCAVSISDISHEGSFVKLENTSATKDCEIGGWGLERIYPKGRVKYNFPGSYCLKKGQAIKIFGADFKDDKSRGRDDIIADKKECPDWGYGNGSFTLRDEKGIERASSTIEFK